MRWFYKVSHFNVLINDLKIKFYRNCTDVFNLFPNNNNVRTNALIATQLGVKAQYEAAVKLLKKKRVTRYGYVLIRKDETEDGNKPTVLVNFFGEIKALGSDPIWFDDLDEDPEDDE